MVTAEKRRFNSVPVVREALDRIHVRLAGVMSD
jgi:hypothetical protein